jgi:succinate dehydrogenase hydrophobic anchor subunit
MSEENLSEQLAKLSAKVDGIQTRLDLLVTGDTPEHIQNRRVRFAENGNWARHYSTVRMTTTTFLVSLSIGILSFKWNPPAKPEVTFSNLAGGVWIAALCLFLTFTRYTYGEMERARLRRRALPEGAKTEADKSLHPRQDMASWLMIVVTGVFGLLLLSLSGGGSISPLYSCANIVPWLVIASALIGALVTLFGKVPGGSAAKQ